MSCADTALPNQIGNCLTDLFIILVLQVDPTKEQWQKIAEVIQEKELQPFFDNAYQGFASGDSEQDASALRQAVAAGLPVLLAQSFAKNFG